MKYLLDTHIFLWYIEENKELNYNIKNELDFSNKIFISIDSLREIAIKAREQKLKLKIPYHQIINEISIENSIKVVDISTKHLLVLHNLTINKNHNDPFDHIIISQAISEKFTLISADGKFPFYRNQGLLLLENE